MLNPKTNVQIYKVLKAKINTYFEQTGKSRYADHVLWIKMSLFFLLPLAGYILLLVFGGTSLLTAFACYVVLMIGSGFFVVTVGHDASHQALLKQKSANQFLSYAWNFLGISKQLWEIKHHHSHHIYTNIPHQDIDIAESPLLRFSPSYPYRPYYKYQHLYAPLLYSLFGLHIVYVRDFTMYFSIKNTTLGLNKLPRYFLAQLATTKLLYLLVTLIVPVLVLPFAWWQVVLLYTASLAIAGVLMLLVLVVPHINEDAALADSPVAIKGQNDWALHQIHSTVDSSVNSRLLGWLTGGLNTHLVHHLFPNICHVHYLQLTRVIKQELCNQGIKYNEKTFSASIRDHFRYLKLMGVAPAKIRKERSSLEYNATGQ
jgi:linoleoyl-CoA desaturase